MFYNGTFHDVVKKFNIFLGKPLNQRLNDVEYQLARYHLTASTSSILHARYLESNLWQSGHCFGGNKIKDFSRTFEHPHRLFFKIIPPQFLARKRALQHQGST